MASPAIDMGVLSIIGLGEGRGVSRCFCFRRSASFSCSHCSAILPQSMAAWLLDLEGEPGCVIQGLDLACGSPEERPPRSPWDLHSRRDGSHTYGQQCFSGSSQSPVLQGTPPGLRLSGDPEHPPRLTACLLSVYSLWLLLPLPGAGGGLGLGLGRLWGGAGLQLVVLWRGDGLAGRCVGVAGGH